MPGYKCISQPFMGNISEYITIAMSCDVGAAGKVFHRSFYARWVASIAECRVSEGTTVSTLDAFPEVAVSITFVVLNSQLPKVTERR